MAKLTDEILWITVIVNISFGVIAASLIAYHLYRFKQRESETVILKRYPKLVFAANMMTIIALPLHTSFNGIKVFSPLKNTNYNLWLIVARGQSALNVLTYGIQCILIARFWLMFYDLNYSNSNMNQQWKVHLDPTLPNNDFWLKHKTTFGSVKYTLKISIIVLSCYATIAAIFVNLDIENSSGIGVVIHGLLYMLINLSYLVLFCKAPRILDIFYLRYEIKLISIILTSIWIYIVITTLIIGVKNEIISHIALAFRSNAGPISYTAICLGSTWMILRQIDNKYNKKYTQQVRKQKSKELQRILLDQHNFQLFVQHVAREFSVECILAFIEMVQFKMLIDKTFNLNCNRLQTTRSTSMTLIDEEKEEKGDFDFKETGDLIYDYKNCNLEKNSAIPKSFVVYRSDHTQKDANDITPFLKIMHKLYEKYIQLGVEMEINISGAVRDIFIDEMGVELDTFLTNMATNNNEKGRPLEPIDLFEYFDEVIEEMYCLLTYSCDRFLGTDTNVNVARLHLVNMDTNQIENTLTGLKKT